MAFKSAPSSATTKHSLVCFCLVVSSGYRIFTEQIFPRLAKELKLKEGWDYKDLYLSILEDLAKQYRISRFKIYTVEELLRLIHKKAGTAALKAMIPRNRDVQFFHHGFNHGSNCLKSCHILSCALGYAQDNRGIL